MIDKNGSLMQLSTTFYVDADGMLRYEDEDLRRRIEEARNAVEPNPSDAQKEYGNYRKGHVTIQGLPITIENFKGGTRSGKDKDGKVWCVTMAHDYGYIKRTESEADGDHVDVFIGPHPESELVFVIDQIKESGRFDEHKCILPGQILQGNVVGASKAFYSGKTIQLSCASGKTLAVTANHPVLTLRGMVSAGDLRKSDYLLAYIGKDEFSAPSDDEQYAPSTVEKVFSSLAKFNPLGLSCEFVSPLDFHGDARFFKSQVEIVKIDGKLRSYLDAHRRKSFDEQNLVGPLMAQIGLTTNSSFHSSFFAEPTACVTPTSNLANSLGPLDFFRRGQSRNFKPYRFGITSDVDLSILKSAANDTYINSETIGDVLSRLSADVTIDQIVNIEMVHYSGPVFDFQSVSGLILINQLVISNCMLGFTNEKEAREGYLANYSSGWKGLGAIKAMRMPEFKEWIKSEGTGNRIEEQCFSYMIDERGNYISDLVIQKSTQAMADAMKEGDEKKLAKATKRWAGEIKMRQMLHHMLIDYNGYYEDRFVTIGGHPEGEKQHAGGTVIKINSEGKIEGGGPHALKGTNVSEAKTTLEKVHESPVNKQGKLESPEMPPKVEISPEGKFTPKERPKTRAERREARRKAGGGKTAKYNPAKDRTGHTLYKIISRMGGISRESAEKFGIKDLMESGLSGLLPKQGGKNLEQIAQQLHSEGHIAIPGYTTEEAESTGAHRSVGAESKRTAADPSEYLIELVKAKAKSLHAELEDEFAKSQKAYYQELENARKAGIDQSEIEDALRSGEADGISEAEKGDAFEGTEFGGEQTEEPIIDDEGKLIPF